MSTELELARKAGVSEREVKYIEKGLVEIRIETLHALVHATGVQPHTLWQAVGLNGSK